MKNKEFVPDLRSIGQCLKDRSITESDRAGLDSVIGVNALIDQYEKNNTEE